LADIRPDRIQSRKHPDLCKYSSALPSKALASETLASTIGQLQSFALVEPIFSCPSSALPRVLDMQKIFCSIKSVLHHKYCLAEEFAGTLTTHHD
jgi:hypothetical protein